LKKNRKRRKYTVRYRANTPNGEATIEKARKMGIRVRGGGGRPTRGGEPSETGQFVFDLKNIDSVVEINAKSGIVQFFYPSLPKLKKCVQTVKRFYVPQSGNLNLRCEGPVDPLDRAVEFSTIVNWDGTGMALAQAKTHLYQWFDPRTGEYLFLLPDLENRVINPRTNYTYIGCFPISIIAVDEDDENGNRIVTGERLAWKMLRELKRITREHPRFKPERKI